MKLSPEKLEALVAKAEFIHHGTLTICILKLTNGAVVTGESNVITPANFDAKIGQRVARENAIDKLWGLEGYALKTRGN